MTAFADTRRGDNKMKQMTLEEISKAAASVPAETDNHIWVKSDITFSNHFLCYIYCFFSLYSVYL